MISSKPSYKIISQPSALLFSAATFAGLTFGSLDSKAQYSYINLEYSVNNENFTNKIEAKGYIKGSIWSKITYEDTDGNYSFDKVYLWTHIDSNKLKYQYIEFGEQKKVDYISRIWNHSLKKGEWGAYSDEISIQKNFPLKIKDRINKVRGMNKSCGWDWKDFLDKNLEKFGEAYKVKDIDQYSIGYGKINGKGFPQEIFIGALDYDYSKDIAVCFLRCLDTNNDGFYDSFHLGVKKNVGETPRFDGKNESININHEKGVISYSSNLDSIEIKDGKEKDFTSEQWKRIKKIVNLDVGCGDNELIPFLYEQYDKWSEK